ncbi:hypothetical protein ACTA71_004540 [Dictyostelium dimigraforme]
MDFKKDSFQLIRNATFVLNYGGKKFLMDPLLAKKDEYPGFEGTVNSHVRNPMVELPVSIESLYDYDAMILTHLHPDHWDEVAKNVLPKEKLIYCQNEIDAIQVRESGFKNVQTLKEGLKFNDSITLHLTSCQHGSKEAFENQELAKILGEVTGVVFEMENKKKVYIVGDTIWTDGIERTLLKYKPEIVVINSGFAQFVGFGAIIMGKEDVGRIRNVLPDSLIIATHMEAINHCILSRKELDQYVKEKKYSNVKIPKDGETINF